MTNEHELTHDEEALNNDASSVLDEQPGCLGDEGGEDSHLEADFEERTELHDEGMEHGWPGDGSGEDDLADYNANEADDYRNEGADDCGDYPDTPLGDELGGE